MNKQFLICFVFFCAWILRAEEAAEKPEAEKPAEAEVEKVETVFSVDDETGIRKQTGSEITVEGTVFNAFWVRDNVLMITFREEKSGFIAVSFANYREKLDEAFNGSIADILPKKKVKITGKVTEFNNRPQIVVESPDQITVVE